ncbi:Hypothetical protein POVR2_LOCUS327 [uncultured virus]|nr:Hypothetical protein POVR2_LOCUS327 [uncultured virus]
MNPGSIELREYTFRGLIPEARDLLVTLYGSFDQYARAIDYDKKSKLEDACVLYSRSIEYPVCAIAALKSLNVYNGEKDDDAVAALHYELQEVISGVIGDTCSTCS